MLQCVMLWLLCEEGEVSLQVHHVGISTLKGYGGIFFDTSPTSFTIHSMQWSKQVFLT